MLRQVRSFFAAHGEGRFSWYHRAYDDHNSKTLNRVGWRRVLRPDGTPISRRTTTDELSMGVREDETVEWLVDAGEFEKHVATGFDPKAVAQVLFDHGCLVKPENRSEAGRLNKNFNIPGQGSVRCYRITSRILELDL